MRLLLVIPNIVSFRSFLAELCAQAIADGDEIHVACSPAEQWNNAGAAPEHPGVRFHAIDFPRGMDPLRHARAAGQLRRLVRIIRPDLVHAHFSAAIFTTALARSGDWPRTIATFHGVSFPARQGPSGAIIRLAETFAARSFDEVAVLTEDDAASLRAAAPGLLVRTLSSTGLGCDLARFAPATAAQRTARRAELGFAPDDCVFIFVGRFVSFKGFDKVARAFLALAADRPNVRLLLAGATDPIHSTGLTAAEDRALRGCAQVVDAGYQNDVERFLAAADVMAFPSSREGMPVCLMEALAMGLPAITRDTRGCRDVVRDGRDGLVLRRCTDDSLRQAMASLADDPALRRRLAAEALAGRERFSRTHFIAAQRRIYAKLTAPAEDAARSGGSQAPVKVAHVTTIVPSLHGLLLNQMRSLAEAGYEVCGISSPGHEVSALAAVGIAHFAVPISRNLAPLKDLKSLWRLWRTMRRERFTIVHTHTPKAGLLGQLAARLAGVPIVANTVHGFYLHERMHPAARRGYIFLERLAARCSDIILSQNKEDVETAVRERICPPQKILHLGNGIDLTQFMPERVAPAEIARRREECGLPPGTPVVGFVGRLAGRRKGFHDFLAAARHIVKVMPDARFLIVGAPDHGKPDAVDSSLTADDALAGHCFFAGHRENDALPAFYLLMNVLVLPSLFEGVPRVVMEAAAMGVPSVVSDVKGNREAVIHESTGLIVPLGNVSALAAAILRLLQDSSQAAAMGAAGRRMAAERFDERVVFTRIAAEYARLLRTDPPRQPSPPPRAEAVVAPVGHEVLAPL